MILTYLYFKKQIVFFTKNFLMIIDIFKYIYEQEVFIGHIEFVLKAYTFDKTIRYNKPLFSFLI